jgi:Tol biopolymer transport system component
MNSRCDARPTGRARTDIYLLDMEDGVTTDLTNTPTANEDWSRFSPNGQQVAFHSDRTGNYEIFVLDLRTDVLTQATSYAGLDHWPAWSPDGKRLAIRRDTDVYLLELATGVASQLTTDPRSIRWPRGPGIGSSWRS